MTHAIDLQADALLLALTEQHGGDLHAAFALLCARVTPDDIIGEPFEAALARAVRACFHRRPSLARPVPPVRMPDADD